MRIFVKISAKLTACGLLFAANLAPANPLAITEKEINHYLEHNLAEKVPLENKVGFGKLFQLHYKLDELSTQIGRTDEKRVAVTGLLDGKLSLQGRNYDAKIQLNLDTIPYYSPEKGALYLQDVRLKNWHITPDKYQNQLQMLMPMLMESVSSLLNHYPVYTLDESDTKQALIKKFGKGIVVEKGQIRLEASLF
ncbi:hypothetical protein A4G20_07150 [Pasteurellaceae bacterium RH1A]|nr:hypothetical protein A4G20_07150 [Pasteurellaceae bacterium RH1A]